MTDQTADAIIVKLKARSASDPSGFRRVAAWGAIMTSPDLAAVRQKLSADDIQRIISAVVPAAVEAHDWFTYGRLNWECCRACGIVRRKDGQNSPCKGVVSVGPREQDVIPSWMTARGYATGHGDTIEDMLSELEAQAIARGAKP